MTDGQIEGVLGAIGDLDGAVNPVVVDLGRLKPFEQQRSRDHDPELFVSAVRGMAGVFDSQGHVESSWLGGASTQKAFRGQRDSFGKIAAGHAPDVGRSAAGGMQKNVEFHARFDWGQRFVHHGQGESARRADWRNKSGSQ